MKETKFIDHLKLTENQVYYSYRREGNMTGTSISNTFKGRVMDYLKDCVDSSECQEKESTTLKEDLTYLLNEFQRVALYPNNIQRVSRRNAFKDYLMGLPSNINIPFYYYDMFSLLADLLEDKKLKDDVIEFKVKGGHMDGKTINYVICTESMCEFYYNMIEQGINNLLSANDLPVLNDLDLIS